MTSKPLAEWTDDEIRTKLRALGESDVPITNTTRSFLLRKIEKSLHTDTSQEKSNHSLDTDCTQTATSSESLEACSGAPANNLDHQVAVEGYYAVVRQGVVEDEHREEQSCPLYTSRADALKAMKNTPGARFKKFESKDAALAYYKSLKQQDTRKKVVESEDTDSSKLSNVSSEKANDFPGLKTPSLNKFRKLIETGDMDGFRDSVWSNPRYLITSGDTPEILQQGCRYNALHSAVRSRKLDICKELLNIIQGDRFWELVYPGDSEEIRQRRKDHLLDLYLNMQDKINCETPLHFACKYGHEDIVAFLVTFPSTCQTIKNKYGQVPADVVCKDGNKSAQSKIEQLLKEPEIYYVPVLRGVDNSTPPQLISPCTLPELKGHGSPLLNSSSVTSPVVGHALAGPMSPSRANEFYREWRSPSQSVERKETSFVKRSDPERGLERVGRKLAHSRGVGWEEYWGFLGCSCDLSLPEGQQLVEEYLKDLSNSSSQLTQSPIEDGEADRENPLSLGTPTSSSSGAAAIWPSVTEKSVPRKLLCDDDCKDSETKASSLVASDQEMKESSGDGIVDSLADLLENNLSFKEDTDFHFSSDSSPATAPFNNPIFLAGSKPSKLDLDVLRALDGTQPDSSKFPLLHDWLKNVKSFSEQQQKSWRTPTSLKQGQMKSFRSTGESSNQLVSPLVFSSPSSSTRQDHLRSFRSTVESSNQIVSPLVFSSPSSSTRQDHSFSVAAAGSNSPSNRIITTPKRQQTQTPGRYFDFRPSPHQMRGVAGYRSTGATPQRNGSYTPTNPTRSVSHFRAPL